MMEYKTLLETYLDAGFFICLTPFRITFDSSTVAPRICKWRFQMVIAGIVAVMDIFGSTIRIRQALERQLNNPVDYFTLMWASAVSLMHIYFYIILWTKEHHILNAVQVFRQTFSHACKRTRIPCSASFGYLLCAISIFLGVLPSLKGSHLLPPEESQWSICAVFKAHVSHAKFMFFIPVSPSGLNHSINCTEIESHFEMADVFQGVAHIFIYTSRYLGAYFIDLFMILCAMTLWLGVNDFTHKVMSKRTIMRATGNEIVDNTGPNGNLNGSEISEIIGKYGDLKVLANEINATMGPVLFCFVFEAIFYYAVNLSKIFTARDWHARFQVAHFLLGISSVFGFSAEVTRKMEEFRLWLINGDVGRVIGQERLFALIHETQFKTIGVSACNGVFTIDYPLVFNIVTTTVTFFLIVVQFVPNTAC